MRLGLLVSGGFPFPPGAEPLDVDTPHGEVRVRFGGPDRGLVFVARHGDPSRPPHRVQHRANLEALRRCGVERVLAVNSVGALRVDVPVPSLLVPHDLVDFTHHPEATFFEESIVHVDVTEPYCPQAHAALRDAARETGLAVAERGVYVTTRGPRLETAAEVQALSRLGDVVGMTGGPEAALAREAGLCYASLCVVVNLGAGLGAPLSQEAIFAQYAALLPRAAAAVEAAALALGRQERSCRCPRVHP